MTNIRNMIFVLMMFAALSACSSGFRSVLPGSAGDTSPAAGKAIMLKPVTGLTEIEDGSLFTAIQSKAAVKKIAVLKETEPVPEEVALVIEGYILNDAGAKTVSVVWDMFTKDVSRQQRFSETLPYSELGIPDNDQGNIPIAALDALAAISVEAFENALGGGETGS